MDVEQLAWEIALTVLVALAGKVIQTAIKALASLQSSPDQDIQAPQSTQQQDEAPPEHRGDLYRRTR